MVIAEINTYDFGSTGRIMLQIAHCAREKGNLVHTYSIGRGRGEKAPEGHSFFCSYMQHRLHYAFAKLTGCNGFFSLFPTFRLVRGLKKLRPDVVHLHNLHGFYINLPILFAYLKKHHIRVIWTLHDCWAFTGKCPHYVLAGCHRWKTGCHHCPQLSGYPTAKVDVTKPMWKLKRRWFTGLEDMTIVTPSQWLAQQVKESFLKDYPVKVINNGIDLSVFKPTPGNFREKYGIGEDTFILLGVAFGWGERKGLDVFIELSKRLDERYQIVLVGTDENVDRQLPKNIISIHRTQDQRELAEIYTAANLFINPTREDTFPTVNMESLACGTPVLTFKTGGSPEIIDENSGAVVDCDHIDALEREIDRVSMSRPYSTQACANRAGCFDMHKKFEEYILLYEDACDTK